MRRVERPPDRASPLVGLQGELGWFSRTGDLLLVCIPDSAVAAEAVLRYVWQIITDRAGGFLIHASATARDDCAFVASFHSGGGKSTLARLARHAGATLLSDEVIQVFPDGSVCGTPFRSDADNVGTPTRARAKWFVGLSKGDTERIAPMSPAAAMELLAAQTFDAGPLNPPGPVLRRRQLQFLSNVQCGMLTFRKHPDAGKFVVDLLENG